MIFGNPVSGFWKKVEVFLNADASVQPKNRRLGGFKFGICVQSSLESEADIAAARTSRSCPVPEIAGTLLRSKWAVGKAVQAGLALARSRGFGGYVNRKSFKISASA